MSRDINPFGLRMPPELRAKIEKACKESGRSMNAEIVLRLERSIAADQSGHDLSMRSDDLRHMMRALKNSLRKDMLEDLQQRTPEQEAELKRLRKTLRP